MRLAPCLLLSFVALGCGGAPRNDGASAAGGPQSAESNSNAPATRDVLRLRPGGPIAFATSLRVHLASEMMGEPMSADFETRGVRRVLDVQEDGSLSIEELETQTRYAITMMGSTRSGPDAATAPVARHYVLGDRGRRIETPRAPSAGAPAQDGEMQDRLEMALDPLVRALEFPEGAVAPGEEWVTSGRIPFGDVDPGLAGEATFRVAQRLERFEGSGESRVAVISFDGSMQGAGASLASGQPMMPGQPGDPMMPGQPMPMPGQPMPGMPGDPMMPGGPMDMTRLAGEVRFRGFYVVAVADGFARTAQADFEGEVQLGEGGILSFPLRGELEWSATPIAAGLPVDAAARAPEAAAGSL